MIATAHDYVSEADSIASAHGFSFSALPVEKQAAYFLKQVWQHIPITDLLGIVAHTDSGHQSYWAYHDDIQDDNETGLYDWANDQNKDYSIYFNVASRKQNVASRYKKGTYAELLNTPALWCDIDSAKDHQSLEVGFNGLMAFELKPSIVTFSGGGLQAYWLLNDVWNVENETKARDFSEWQRGFFFNKFQQNGFSFDKTVFDTTRELRLVGYVNKKANRQSAIARIIFSSDTRYTREQIKAHSTPPKIPSKRAYYPAIEFIPGASPISHQDNIYHLTPEICRYFFNGEIPEDGERHYTARNLSFQAAISGVPLELWLAHLINLAESWYVDGEIASDFEENITQAASWAYDRVNESAQFDIGHKSDLFGWVQENQICATRITTNEFSRVKTADLSKQDEKIIKTTSIPSPLAYSLQPIPMEKNLSAKESLLLSNSANIADTTHLPSLMTLSEIRQQIPLVLENFKNGLNLQNRQVGLNSILLLKAPPGSGKSHATIKYLEKVAQDNECVNMGDTHKGKALLLTHFKIDNSQSAAMLKHFDVEIPSIQNMQGRNDNPLSPGYCIDTEKANLLASRGENVTNTLCQHCAIAAKCKISGYLSQYPESRSKELLIARHQHGLMGNVLQGRTQVVIDESPLDKVSAAFKVRAEEMHLPRLNPWENIEYAEQIKLIKQVLDALKSVVLSNPSLAGTPYPTDNEVKLGGRWLFEMLFRFVDEQIFKGFIELDNEIIKEVTHSKIDYTSSETILQSPPNFVCDLIAILDYEYSHFYSKKVIRWNSRLIVYGHALHIHAMHPYQIMKRSKVIVTDATGLPDLYPIAFTDKQGRAKHIEIYAPALEHKAEIIQLTGTDNCKTTVVRPIRKAKQAHGKNIAQNAPILHDTAFTGHILPDIEIPGIAYEGATLKEIESSSESLDLLAKNEDIYNWQETITYLSKKHNKSLLVVTYRELAQYIRLWATRNNIIEENNIQWFGNLKGRNDYENLDAVLILGTPRINQMDLLSLAQVWHWQDDSPIELDQELKTIDFPGTGLARQYRGYVDPRVNTLYLHMIQSEMRQCYERIRPQSSPTKKFVYIASGMPCSDYVSKIISYRSFVMLDQIKPHFDRLLEEFGKVPRAKFIAEIQKSLELSYDTASRYYDMCIEGRDDIEVTMVGRKKIVVRKDQEGNTTIETPPTKFQTVLDWLNSDPNRDKWHMSAKQVIDAIPGVSVATATKAIQEWRRELY